MKIVDKDMRVYTTSGGYHVLQYFDHKWNEWYTERLIDKSTFRDYMNMPEYIPENMPVEPNGEAVVS